MAFKWTEEELQNVAVAMYKQMTNFAYTNKMEYWPAFKYAQALINPKYKYSTNSQNTDLMKELRRRINLLYANCKNKVEVKVVLDVATSKTKAADIMKKIGKNGLSSERRKDIDDARVEALHQHLERIRKVKELPKTRKLLTGNVVETLDHQVTISITTTCPRKWVLVDLETGNQYGSPGIKTTQEMLRVEPRQTWTNPVRKVMIPKPKKKSKKFDVDEFKRSSL